VRARRRGSREPSRLGQERGFRELGLEPADTCLPDYRSNFEFSTNTDPENPPPGKVFIYLYKFCNGTSTCSYGQTSAGQERTPGSGSCP